MPSAQAPSSGRWKQCDPSQRIATCRFAPMIDYGNATGLYLHEPDGDFGSKAWSEMRNSGLSAVRGAQRRRVTL